MAALVLVATACDRSGGGGADANVTAWCAQLDVAATAGAAVDGLDVDDPGTDEALAAVRDAFAALADLEPPAAIAGDWETVTGPLPTTEAGGIDLEGRVRRGRRSHLDVGTPGVRPVERRPGRDGVQRRLIARA